MGLFMLAVPLSLCHSVSMAVDNQVSSEELVNGCPPDW